MSVLSRHWLYCGSCCPTHGAATEEDHAADPKPDAAIAPAEQEATTDHHTRSAAALEHV